MTVATDKQNSRTYSAPKLVVLGDMTSLTKNSSGSSIEASGNMGVKTKS